MTAGAQPGPARGALTGRRVRGYELAALLGRGGMGEVYAARDLEHDREVAVKVVRPDLVASETAQRRFRREAEAARRVRHPSVAVVLDAFEEAGSSYLVMERVEGRGLDEVMTAGRLGPLRVAFLGAEVAGALAAIHAAFLVHRDLKPSNVMVLPAGRVKVMDFGLVRLLETGDASGAEAARLTRAGVAVGTLHYMSPEQIAGEEVDPRSDLFALGVLLYSALAGRRLWERDTRLATARAILATGPEGEAPAAGVAHAGPVATVVLALLRKRRDERPGSAAEVARALRAAAADLQRPPS